MNGMNIKHKGYMKACGNRGVIFHSIYFHNILHAFSTPPLEAFPPMSQRV